MGKALDLESPLLGEQRIIQDVFGERRAECIYKRLEIPPKLPALRHSLRLPTT